MISSLVSKVSTNMYYIKWIKPPFFSIFSQYMYSLNVSLKHFFPLNIAQAKYDKKYTVSSFGTYYPKSGILKSHL